MLVFMADLEVESLVSVNPRRKPDLLLLKHCPIHQTSLFSTGPTGVLGSSAGQESCFLALWL